MATHKQPQVNKTYATEANAHKAVNSVDWIRDGSDLTYFIQPVLVGIRFDTESSSTEYQLSTQGYTSTSTSWDNLSLNIRPWVYPGAFCCRGEYGSGG